MYWYKVCDHGPSVHKFRLILQSLAEAELFLTLATIFRRYDMELFDTNFERDVELKHDMFLPQLSDESRGMRFLFK
jgi:hypothetical protein